MAAPTPSASVGDELPSGHRLLKPLPGGGWRVAHPDHPGRSFLLDPTPRLGRGAPSRRLDYPLLHVPPELERLAFPVAGHPGPFRLYAFDGLRLLSEVPAPLPIAELHAFGRAALALLDASQLPLQPLTPEQVLWRARGGAPLFIPHVLPPGTPLPARREAERAVVAMLTARLPPALHALREDPPDSPHPLARWLATAAAAPQAPPRGAAAICSLGRARALNEDSFGWAYAGDTALYVVADGQGGFGGGPEASRAAVAAMLARFDPHVADPIRLLEEGFRAAQAAVSQHPGVGATCIAAIVRGQRVWLGHVGDCRAYTERFGDLRRRTEDHSLVAREVALGRLDPAAARHHPHANILLRALGEGGDGAAELSEFGLPHGERLLLCTDGLHATLDDEAIGATLRVQPNAHAAVSAVHDAVLIAGAPDNVAAILVDTSR